MASYDMASKPEPDVGETRDTQPLQPLSVAGRQLSAGQAGGIAVGANSVSGLVGVVHSRTSRHALIQGIS